MHRDIKPSNLLVDRDQRIWLTDFGLARNNDDSSANQSIAYQGTPKYMSPEQASATAAPVDHRTDIYSLGATLIEWLTGESVVGGSNPVESLSRLQQNSIEEPQVQLRGYSRDWLAVLEKCIAREPTNRYQTAAELATDLHALAERRPVSARHQHAAIRLFRSTINQKTVLQAAITSIAAIALLGLVSTAWRAYTNSKLHPVIFESSSGEWLTVYASDTSDNPISTFTAPSDEVLLPGKEVRLDVSASQRLGYRRTIDPTSSDIFNKVKAIYLDAPQTHRWIVDDILWYQSLNIIRNDQSSNCCIALRGDGLILLDIGSGKALWSFHDVQSQWGDSVRGCPSTFQPDRCVVIQDTNGNGCQEIIFAHPRRPELLCLDGKDGEQLWRTNLLESAGIQTPDALSICPIVLQEFNHTVGSELCVVVAPHVPALAATNRWLMSVDPVQGNVRWKLASQQSLAKPTNATATSARPLHLQWGEIEKRPLDFGHHTTSTYFDDYWTYVPTRGMLNPYDPNVRLGTDRPFKLSAGDSDNWHWIDGQDWHKINARSGELVKTWTLPADCVRSPRLLRTPDGRTLVLTVQPATRNMTDFVTWDGEADEPVWQQTLQCDLDRLPQSYLSRESDFPIVVDLDGDGADEWFAPLHIPGTRWSHPMSPPYGMVTAHRGDDGTAIWNEPFNLPNMMNEMVERGIVVSDQDRDGWKDLLLGSRFQGGGVQGGVACFVDLVSGKTGKRIWHSQVRTESNKPTLGPNELVDLTVLEDQHFIAVVTYSGFKSFNMESARPYSTTFLSLESGEEEAFGLGIRASSFSHDAWIEYRLPPEPGQRANRARPGQLVGWAYPELKADSIDNLTLWRSDEYSCAFFADVDHDGFPEVIGHKNNVGYREDALLNGLTGKKSWSKKIPTQKNATQKNTFWLELEQDVDKDGLDDLAVLISDADYGSPGLPNEHLQFATVEIISGATGRTIWKHSATELGMVNLLAFFKRDSGRPPLLIYQNDRSKKVTCVDIDARKIAWESNSYNANLDTQAFETWIHDGKIVWFSTNDFAPWRMQSDSLPQVKAEQGNANFVNAETGEVLLQIPIGQRSAVPWANWIQWGGRELLPIQTITECSPVTADSAPSYRTDLWLVDRSVKLVGHWSETTSVASSAVAATWFQKSHYDLPLPTIVKTLEGKELFAMPIVIDGSIGYRLLGWDDSEPQKVATDRTVRLPIDPNSTSACVSTLDCDGDGYSDFVSSSDSGLDCISSTGDPLWHRPPIPTARLLGTFEKDGKGYLTLQTEPATGSVFYMDARTGEKCDVLFDADPTNRAFNKDNPKHVSLIVEDHTTVTSRGYFSSILRSGTRVPRTGKSPADPRYVRLLPWVVNAKFFLLRNPVTARHISLTRILKPALGVFIVPFVVVWICMRMRFTIRQLLLVASTIALALSLVLADNSAFPTDDRQLGYSYALEGAFFLAFHTFLLVLPLIELTKARWRRRLSLIVYVAFLVIVPLFGLLAYPASVIPTTYTYQEFWHLFWFALLPTGFVLLMIHSFRIVGKGVLRIASSKIFGSLFSKKVAQASGLQIAGDSHGR